MHINSIDEGSKMTHVFDIDVGAILNGSIVSTNALCCGLPLRIIRSLMLNKIRGNMVMKHPNAHLQHV